MPNIKQMMGSKYLKQDDVPQPALVTISHLDQQEVNDGDGKKELKWCLHFAEFDKPLILNPTNTNLCALACGSEESDEWHGKKVVLYTDPTVSMGGKLVGGLRIRPRRDQPQPAPAARPAQPAQPKTPGGKFDDMVDDIPF